MRKMVQSSHRLVQLVLLCLLWQLGTPCFGRVEHRSMGVHQETKTKKDSLGQIAFFCLYVLLNEIGKKLDKGQICPLYCGIKHKHIYEKKESHIQRTDRILRPGNPEDRE